MAESESGGRNISVAQLAELAALDAFGLLDDHEAAQFAAAFSNAPESVQQQVLAIQSQLAEEPQLLPDAEPGEDLARRVRERVALAMQRERSGNEETPALPSESEIASLPRRAQVAFAARCARRVQPLFQYSWPNALQEHVDAVDRANSLAQTSAVSPVSVSELEAARAAARAAHPGAAIDITLLAALVADAAIAAIDARDTDAARAAADVARTAAALDATAHVTIRRDFELLKAAAEREKWTDDTPVPPEFFGPLWPHGVPAHWPNEDADQEIEPHALKVQFTVPRGMTKQESRKFNEKVQAFFITLSALDASMGGTGLQILDDESEDPIDIEDEEPVHTDADCTGVGA